MCCAVPPNTTGKIPDHATADCTTQNPAKGDYARQAARSFLLEAGRQVLKKAGYNREEACQTCLLIAFEEERGNNIPPNEQRIHKKRAYIAFIERAIIRDKKAA